MKCFKIIIIPVITSLFLFISIKIDLFPLFFEKTKIDVIIYRFLFPDKNLVSPFDTFGIAICIIGIIPSILLLIIKILIKDKYIKIGLNVSLFFFVLLILYGIYIWVGNIW